jgi:hypothetical protein
MPCSSQNPALKPPPMSSLPRMTSRLVLLLPLAIDLIEPRPWLFTWRTAASATPAIVTELWAPALPAARASAPRVKRCFMWVVSLLN